MSYDSDVDLKEALDRPLYTKAKRGWSGYHKAPGVSRLIKFTFLFTEEAYMLKWDFCDCERKKVLPNDLNGHFIYFFLC